MAISEIKRDYHVHTNFSDGYSTPQELIEFGISKRLDQICFTDHYSLFKPAVTEETFDIYFETIENLKKKFSTEIDIFIGIEVDTLSILNFEAIGNYPWDLILFEYVFSHPEWEAVFSRVRKFTHDYYPSQKVGFAHTRFSRVRHTKFENIMENIREYEFIIELNTGYRNYIDSWFNYLDEENFFSVGSDAHSLDQLGNVKEAINYLISRKIPTNRIIEL